LPKNPVRYPAASSQVAIVDRPSSSAWNLAKPPVGHSLPCTRWLCEYWPRKIVLREGQQKALVTK